jgi:hypothetical protein
MNYDTDYPIIVHRSPFRALENGGLRRGRSMEPSGRGDIGGVAVRSRTVAGQCLIAGAPRFAVARAYLAQGPGVQESEAQKPRRNSDRLRTFARLARAIEAFCSGEFCVRRPF